MEFITNFIGAVICIALFIGFVYIFGLRSIFKTRYLIKNGIPAVAKVISIEKTMYDRGSGALAKPVMEVTLEIDDAETSTREVTIETIFNIGKPVPKAGDKVNILIDPKNENNIMIAPKLG